jgi:signal transduction histidine kinase
MDGTSIVTTRSRTPESAPDDPDRVSGPARRRVLLVEDNEAHARLATLWLEHHGHGRYEALPADRLSAALDRLGHDHVDVVLLDLSLPDSDRLETYRRVRAHAPLVPIVVMTGIGDERLALQAMEEGAQDYLVKGDLEGHHLVRALDYAIVRKRADDAERQMLEAQRLEGLAVLAGGVAHQLNNLLVVIMGNASLASAEVPPHHAVRQHLHEIEIASERAARLARQMLAYSGRGGFVVGRVDLNELVRAAADALARDLPAGTTLQLRLAEQPVWIDADESQVAQLLFSLVTNAAEATEGRATEIVLATSYAAVTEDDLARGPAHWALAPGPCARLEVIDQGAGMTPAVVARVFEPFFSTRLTGRGLGLPAALGVVRGHGGAITIDSTPGSGTRVSVWLPHRGER